MRVIVLQNIKGFGQIGDVKKVADGYARNFLFPRKMAKLATDAALKEVDSLKKKLANMEKREKENAVNLAKELKDIVLEFIKKATKTGKLYSAVTKEDIADMLKTKIDLRIEPESINLDDHNGHIKQLGEHMVKVKLAPDVVVEVKVKVSAEEK